MKQLFVQFSKKEVSHIYYRLSILRDPRDQFAQTPQFSYKKTETRA